MSKGTDGEIFGDDDKIDVQTNGSKGGRPTKNRDLARRLFQADFSTKQVAKKLKCHINTARTIRRELEAAGLLDKDDREEGLSVVQADFDAECEIAVGISFSGWLKARTKAHKRIFAFCQRTWVMWEKPSLVYAKNEENKLGDQLCMKFLDKFAEDDKRIRNRKKMIRNLFRFLGRRDLCDRYLSMTQSRDPRNVKRIPQIGLLDFPQRFQAMLDELNTLNPQVGLAAEFKLCSMMRTGVRADERGLMGIRVGAGSQSYILMNGPDDVRIHVLEKMREEWDITWLPRRVRERLWALYQQREVGDPLFSFDVRVLRTMVKELALKHMGIADFIPHDIRKVSITWLFVMGVPLELAIMINVGWKDMSTVQRHYIHMRNILKKSDRLAYREKIPDWFKDDLTEYTEEK